jgi:hypothetical protein
MSLYKKKNVDDILQEEFLQERAAVLGRAGDSVSRALEKMQSIDDKLQEHLQRLRDFENRMTHTGANGDRLEVIRRQIKLDINREIAKYNGAREYALTRYYYLIVTREAMGMRRHHWVEKHYSVPPRKKLLPDH